MNTPLFFDNAGDERGTPQKFFDTLHTEFHFDLDAAATEHNHKCELYYGQGGIEYDALEADWAGMTVFLNPPYSATGAFVAKARDEANKGATVVLLLPVRSDTKWWQTYVWDRSTTKDGDWYPGVRFRLLPGRLTFELFVPADLRAWLKSEYATAIAVLSEGAIRERAITEWFRQMVETTGLPRMAIARILEDFPDDDLLGGAPFPSCVVIFSPQVPS